MTTQGRALSHSASGKSPDDQTRRTRCRCRGASERRDGPAAPQRRAANAELVLRPRCPARRGGAGRGGRGAGMDLVVAELVLAVVAVVVREAAVPSSPRCGGRGGRARGRGAQLAAMRWSRWSCARPRCPACRGGGAGRRSRRWGGYSPPHGGVRAGVRRNSGGSPRAAATTSTSSTGMTAAMASAAVELEPHRRHRPSCVGCNLNSARRTQRSASNSEWQAGGVQGIFVENGAQMGERL
jgi:hypothetical protein